MARSWKAQGAAKARTALASVRTPTTERWADRLGTRLMERRRPLPIAQALALESLLPDDPLAGRVADPLDVVIPVGSRDVPLLATGWALDSVLDPFVTTGITLVTPKALREALQASISEYPPAVPWRVLSDEDLLPDRVADVVEETVPEARHGWVRQQLVKWNVALTSDVGAVLVIDADTRLLRSRTWLSGGVQILTPVLENHRAYKAHIRRVLPGIPRLPISFVAHHQVIQRDILTAMLDAMGGSTEGQVAWIRAADWSDSSALSEYDTYAAWALATCPQRVVLARWGNFPAGREGLHSRSGAQRRSALSLSDHWYSRD